MRGSQDKYECPESSPNTHQLLSKASLQGGPCGVTETTMTFKSEKVILSGSPASGQLCDLEEVSCLPHPRLLVCKLKGQLTQQVPVLLGTPAPVPSAGLRAVRRGGFQSPADLPTSVTPGGNDASGPGLSGSQFLPVTWHPEGAKHLSCAASPPQGPACKQVPLSLKGQPRAGQLFAGQSSSPDLLTPGVYCGHSSARSQTVPS